MKSIMHYFIALFLTVEFVIPFVSLFVIGLFWCVTFAYKKRMLGVLLRSEKIKTHVQGIILHSSLIIICSAILVRVYQGINQNNVFIILVLVMPVPVEVAIYLYKKHSGLYENGIVLRTGVFAWKKMKSVELTEEQLIAKIRSAELKYTIDKNAYTILNSKLSKTLE